MISSRRRFLVYAGYSTGSCFHRIHGQDHLELGKDPWPLRRSRGGWQWRSLRSLALPSFLRRTPDTALAPFVPVQSQSTELPATTVGEWRRRHTLRRHKGGLWTAFFYLPPHVLLQCGFLHCVAGTFWPNEGVRSGLLEDMLTPLRKCNCLAPRKKQLWVA